MGFYQGRPWEHALQLWNHGYLVIERTMNTEEGSGPKQKFVVAGERAEGDPALLPCHGSCGSGRVAWTWHQSMSHSVFRCRACQSTRRWGLGFG